MEGNLLRCTKLEAELEKLPPIVAGGLEAESPPRTPGWQLDREAEMAGVSTLLRSQGLLKGSV